MLFIHKNLPDTYSEWLESEGLADSFQLDRFEFESLPFHPEPEDHDSEDQTLETNDSESLPFHPEPEDGDSDETLEMEMDNGDAEADSDINFTIFNDPPEVSTSPDPRRGGDGDGDGNGDGNGDEWGEVDEDQSDDSEILRRLMNTPARVHLRALQELRWLEIPVQRALEYLADQESVPASPIQSNNNSDHGSADDVDDS